MRTLAIATFALSLLGSGAAFADAIEVGSASQAPVFAVESGNTADISDIGSASRAPVFSGLAGNGQIVTDVGTASRAPVFLGN